MSERVFMFLIFSSLIIILSSCASMSKKEHDVHALENFIVDTTCADKATLQPVSYKKAMLNDDIYQKRYIFTCGKVSYSCSMVNKGLILQWDTVCLPR